MLSLAKTVNTFKYTSVLQKEQDDMKRFKRFFGLKENEEVPAEAMKLISNQQRISILEKEYQELESQYRYILQHITLL